MGGNSVWTGCLLERGLGKKLLNLLVALCTIWSLELETPVPQLIFTLQRFMWHWAGPIYLDHRNRA